MKARIIKKLSKKLRLMLPKEYKDSWVEREVIEESWEQGSMVSNCQMVGGGLDYWGEGEDHYTVLYDFKYHLLEWQGLWGFYDDENDDYYGMPKGAPYRLTGQKLIMLARLVQLKTRNNHGTT